MGHDLQGAEHESSSASPAGRPPGKRSLTEGLPKSMAAIQAQAAGGKPGAAPAEYPDPYGVHLDLTKAEQKEIAESLHNLVEVLEDLGKKLKSGEKVTGWFGTAFSAVNKGMKQVRAVLEPVAEKLAIVDQLVQFAIATQEWSDAFDAYQQRRSPANAERLTVATQAWCGLMIEVAEKLPQPMRAVVINGLKGAQVAIEVGARVGSQSLSVTRADEAEEHDGPRAPAPAPTPQERAGAYNNPRAYRGAFSAAIEDRQAQFQGGGSVRAYVVPDGTELLDRWDAAAAEIAQLDHFWKIGAADKAKLAEARAREAQIKEEINSFAAGTAGWGLVLPRAE